MYILTLFDIIFSMFCFGQHTALYKKDLISKYYYVQCLLAKPQFPHHKFDYKTIFITYSHEYS